MVLLQLWWYFYSLGGITRTFVNIVLEIPAISAAVLAVDACSGALLGLPALSASVVTVDATSGATVFVPAASQNVLTIDTKV